jgi:hypothetical protein
MVICGKGEGRLRAVTAIAVNEWQTAPGEPSSEESTLRSTFGGSFIERSSTSTNAWHPHRERCVDVKLVNQLDTFKQQTMFQFGPAGLDRSPAALAHAAVC